MTLQSEVTAWADETFGDSTPKAKITHLWEELEEAFAEAGDEADSHNLRTELADCGLITMHLASSLDVVLPEPSSVFADMMRWKFTACKLRKWGRPDANGVVRHVKHEEIKEI